MSLSGHPFASVHFFYASSRKLFIWLVMKDELGVGTTDDDGDLPTLCGTTRYNRSGRSAPLPHGLQFASHHFSTARPCSQKTPQSSLKMEKDNGCLILTFTLIPLPVLLIALFSLIASQIEWVGGNSEWGWIDEDRRREIASIKFFFTSGHIYYSAILMSVFVDSSLTTLAAMGYLQRYEIASIKRSHLPKDIN